MKTSFLSLVCLFLFILLNAPSSSIAQTAESLARIPTDTLPETYKMDVGQLREDIYLDVPEVYRNTEYPRKTYKFADQVSVQMSYLFSGGSVYSDWSALEDYVNEVLQIVLPEELKASKHIHAYIVKDGTFNAFMTPAGMMFVHIGLIEALDSEASLAGILAHELAHYTLRHSLDAYVREENEDFGKGLGAEKDRSDFSIANELASDSLGYIYLQNTGYDPRALVTAAELMEHEEHKILMQLKDVWELEKTTHPSSSKRKDAFQRFITADRNIPDERYLVSEKKFFQFKNAVKSEILADLLYKRRYSICMEKAFCFHLLDPTNPTYVYYVMESIRRVCYLDQRLWNKKFITDKYYIIEGEDDHKKKVKNEDHLFARSPKEFVGMAPHDVERIKAKFYWSGARKFETYEQAFDYFNRVARHLKANECILTNALSLSFDKEKMNLLLKDYLGHENIRYREYAENLLGGTIYSSLPKKKLTAISEFFVIVSQGNDEILVRERDVENRAYIDGIIHEMTSTFPDRKFINMGALKDSQLNHFRQLETMMNFSLEAVVSRGERTEVHILDPQYWEFFRKNGVNEIEFVQSQYYDRRKYESSLEAYKSVVNLDYETFFSETKRSRFLDIYISSVREIENKPMKMRVYGGESKLPFNKSAAEQVNNLIAAKIKMKDKEAARIDKQTKWN